MVTLTRIYTRGGDGGETSLGDGSRVAKDDLRVEAYGAVDEANSSIGVARLATASGKAELARMDDELAAIQNDLFDVGADLCTPEAENEDEARPRLRVQPDQVTRLEHQIDAMNDRLQPLTSFVLPGGTAAAAHLHMARALVRRAERLVVTLSGRERVNPATVQYLNRLSDYLFVAARAANDPEMGAGSGDVLWVPGQSRSAS